MTKTTVMPAKATCQTVARLGFTRVRLSIADSSTTLVLEKTTTFSAADEGDGAGRRTHQSRNRRHAGREQYNQGEHYDTPVRDSHFTEMLEESRKAPNQIRHTRQSQFCQLV